MTDEELQQEIQSLAQAIAKNYQPEQIVLFGSSARHEFHSGSDIDLLIVKDTPKKPLERMREVVEMLPHTLDVDILVLTPQEIKSRRAEGHYLMKEIDAHGQVIFDRTHA